MKEGKRVAFLVIIALVVTSLQVESLTVGETEALNDMKKEWGQVLGWSGAPSCQWSFVYCDTADHVVELSVLTNRPGRYPLQGTIPNSIWKLFAVQAIGLAVNNLTGTVPASIWNLTQLTSLTLVANQLNGTIPDGNWSSS